MARVFSLGTVLRQVPKPLLGQVLATWTDAFAGIDWATLRSREIEPIVAIIEQLPRLILGRIESHLHMISDLANDRGLHAIFETARSWGDHDLPGRVPTEFNGYGQLAWLWLHHQDYFNQACQIFQIESLSHWHKRGGLPCRPANREPEAIEQLRQAISQMLLREQGRGHLCTVEPFCRDEIDYLFVFPDDFLQSVQEHDDEGMLAPKAVRHTFQIVFAHRPGQGILELHAPLPGRLRIQLEELYAEHLLGIELPPSPPRKGYQLDHLRVPTTPLPVDPADAVQVAIKRLDLRISGTNRQIELTADHDQSRDDLDFMLQNYLNREQLHEDDLIVRSVSLCFEFLPLGSRRTGHATVQISTPNFCNLRNQRPERAMLIQKYLQLWGIDV